MTGHVARRQFGLRFVHSAIAPLAVAVVEAGSSMCPGMPRRARRRGADSASRISVRGLDAVCLAKARFGAAGRGAQVRRCDMSRWLVDAAKAVVVAGGMLSALGCAELVMSQLHLNDEVWQATLQKELEPNALCEGSRPPNAGCRYLCKPCIVHVCVNGQWQEIDRIPGEDEGLCDAPTDIGPEFCLLGQDRFFDAACDAFIGGTQVQ